jgi:hypothetical protein
MPWGARETSSVRAQAIGRGCEKHCNGRLLPFRVYLQVYPVLFLRFQKEVFRPIVLEYQKSVRCFGDGVAWGLPTISGAHPWGSEFTWLQDFIVRDSILACLYWDRDTLLLVLVFSNWIGGLHQRHVLTLDAWRF